MKKRFLLGLILCATLKAPAQTAAEWLQQKETGKKYLLEQIAALRVYGDYVKKGYALAGKGWQTIRGIKEGDGKVHRDFFASLSAVNLQVKGSPLVTGIITRQVRTVGKIKEVRHHVAASRLTAPEAKFCHQVLDGLLTDCADALEELLELTASGGLELSDDERLQRLERLYARLQQTYGLTASLGADVRGLSFLRMKQQAEVNRSGKMLGIR